MDESDVPPALSDPARLLQLVMDNIPQFIFWKDRRSVYLGCNENFARAAGVGCPVGIVGKTDHDLAWKDEEAEFFREVDRRVMDSGVAEHNIVEPQLQADGRQAWLRTNKVPLFDEDGVVVGILGTFEDITAERAAEERLRHAQKMESIGRLAGGVAHDFNNMLGGILGAAELLQRQLDDSSKQQDLLRIIIRSGERAADLTSKLLAFSRRGQMERRPTDIHDAIRNTVSILGGSIDRRITVDMQLDALQRTVLGDPSELETALLNLGINARDAVEGDGCIQIRTRDAEVVEGDTERGPISLSPGPYVEVEVTDTGKGIPDELTDRVFEPFFTTKDVGAGTGLGLAAVYGVVTEHGGAITLQGRPGEGARFTILLPTSELRPAPEVSRPPSLSAARGQMRILVVDDEEPIRKVVQQLLGELGYEVTLASDGREAIERFAADPAAFDAVLLDVVMPRMGGEECLHELRALRPDVRVLMSSGFTQDMTVDAFSEGAASGFLKKPYHVDELSEALAKLLRDR